MQEQKKNEELLNMDAWSDGQIRSKLWLCGRIENDFKEQTNPLDIWIFGSWYGLLAQLLLVRERISIKQIKLYDLDAEALRISKKILDKWINEHSVGFSFVNMDCTQLPEPLWAQKPDILINTSAEHFTNDNWLNIPTGIRLYVQSTNMVHPTHINCPQNLNEFRTRMEVSTRIDYSGSLEFRYPNFEFDRYMISGETR